MNAGTRNAVSLSGVLLSALIYTLCFPPHDLRYLAPLALVPHFLAIRHKTSLAAAGLGAIWGLASAWGITYWLPATVAVYYHQPYWLGLSLFTCATLLMVSLEYALASAAYAWCSRRARHGLPFIAASTWIVAEFARAKLLTGNPWGFLGYSQALTGVEASAIDTASLALSQIAELGGVYAVSFVLVLMNAALAEAFASRHDGLRRTPENMAVATIVVLALSFGAFRLSSNTDSTDDGTTVAIVQPDLDLGSQWREELYGQNLREYMEMTDASLRVSPSDLVVWPENAMTFFIAEEPLYRAAIASVLSEFGATLVAGAPYATDSSGIYEYFNSAFVLGPNGTLTGRYDKVQLLPFAEYFPLQSVDLLNRNFGRVRQFSPGDRAQLLATPAGRGGVLICNETMFGSLASARVAGGAEFLIMLSNDSWVTDPMYGQHQLQMAVIRAIEQRRAVVRASTSGPSAIIDAYGRVEAVSQSRKREILNGTVGASSSRTVYSVIGDSFAWICLLLVAAIAVRDALPRANGELSPP
jgi:apolipoprotein N-acyltransferase